jgi:hypothetical protein
MHHEKLFKVGIISFLPVIKLQTCDSTVQQMAIETAIYRWERGRGYGGLSVKGTSQSVCRCVGTGSRWPLETSSPF